MPFVRENTAFWLKNLRPIGGGGRHLWIHHWSCARSRRQFQVWMSWSIIFSKYVAVCLLLFQQREMTVFSVARRSGTTYPSARECDLKVLESVMNNHSNNPSWSGMLVPDQHS